MALQQWKRIIVNVFRDVNQNHTLSFAAGLSYYFVMALFPALIMLAGVVAFLPIPNLFTTILGTLARVVPQDSMGLVRKIVADVITPHHGALFSVGLLGTLWTASGGFSAAIEALNVAYDVPETRPFWKTRLLALELTFLIGFLVTAAFAFMIVGPQFGEFVASHTGLGWAFARGWPTLRLVLSVVFIVLAVEGLYFMAPNVKQRFLATLPGAILAVVGWVLLSDGLSLYFRKFAHLNHTYGTLGGAIALLIWLYWSGFIILLGAELNSAIIQERGDGKLLLKQPPLPKVRPRPPATAEDAKPEV